MENNPPLWIRNKMGLSQAQFGKMLGVSQPAVANWEANQRFGCSSETLHRIREVFIIEIDGWSDSWLFQSPK